MRKNQTYLRKNRGKNTRFYNMWYNLRKRCNDKNTNYYKNYGGRGITYNKDWDNYRSFIKDVYLKYCKSRLLIEKPELDRTDNNEGYFMGNIRFVTHRDNNRNKNNNTNYKGKPTIYWIEKLGLNRSTVYNRISRGWDVEKAIIYKVDHKYNLRY